jgi:purine nucleosidase
MGFLTKIGKFIKRAAIIFVVVATLGSIIYTIRLLRKGSNKPTFSAIIDADTGNGIDNIFAIARALSDPGFEIIGLTSVQWNHYPGSLDNTARMSHEMNDTLLYLFSKLNIPHYQGSEATVGNWIRPAPQRSEASDFIIKKAHEVPKNLKLNIIALGPLTNIASAVLMDSTIIPQIRIYTLSMLYDPATKVWNKNEFNVRNDLDAMDILLNSDGLEMHILPVSSSKSLGFGEIEIFDLMRFKGPQWDFLLEKWNEKSKREKELIMSDVALIEASLNSEYTKEEQGIPPPENVRKPVYIYTWINREFMKIDYWKVIKKYMSDKTK